MTNIAGLPPIATTPEATRDQLTRAAHLLRGIESPIDRLKNFKVMVIRFCHAQFGGLLDEDDLAARLWEVAEGCGLIEDTSNGTVQAALAAAFDQAERCPETEPPKGNGNASSEQMRLERIDLARYDVEMIPVREWGVRDRFPRRNVTLLSGEGGRGKSLLLLQLACAHVLERDWLGSLPEKGPVLLVNCEDEGDELVRRLQPILAHYGAKFADVAPDLHVFSLVDRDDQEGALLAAPDRTGRLVVSRLFESLLIRAREVQPICIIIDNVADVFGGSEIDRSQVRQFVSLMRRLALASNGYVIMSAHPSLSGIANRSGLSGSTQWHNSVRARGYMYANGDNGRDAGGGTRVLEFMKSNYSALAERIELQWSNGLFVPARVPSGPEQAARNAEVETLFLQLLDRSTAKGENLSPKSTANNYAPTVLAKTAEAKAKGFRREHFADALDRLIAAGRIAAEPYGAASRGTSRLVRRSLL